MNRFFLPILCLLTAIAYIPSFGVPFFFDDLDQLLNNPGIQNNSLDIRKIWEYNPPRFLSFLSFAIQFQIAENSLYFYHLANFFIHLINVVLVYFISSKLFELNKEIFSSKAYPFFVACIFALHPIQIMAVSYIIQRHASLVALFYFTSIYSFCCYRLTNSKKWLSFLLLSFLFACFTKQNAITLFPVILCLDYICFKRNPLRNYKLYLALLIPPLLLILITFVFGDKEMHLSNETVSTYYQKSSHFNYFLSQIIVYPEYFKRIFLFSGFKLIYNIKSFHSINLQWITSLLLLSVFFLIAFKNIIKRPFIGFGICFFFASISLEASFFRLTMFAQEHRLYIPLFGLAFSVISTIGYIFHYIKVEKQYKTPSYILALLCLVPLVFALRTYERNKLWNTEENIWLETYETDYGDHPLTTNQLGVINMNKKNYVKAVGFFNQSLKSYPLQWQAYNNLGIIALRSNDTDNALKKFEHALALAPHQSKPILNKASVFIQTKEYEKALDIYNLIQKKHPKEYKANLAKSYIYNELKNFKKAHLELDNLPKHLKSSHSYLTSRLRIYRQEENYLKVYQITKKLSETQPNNFQIKKDLQNLKLIIQQQK